MKVKMQDVKVGAVLIADEGTEKEEVLTVVDIYPAFGGRLLGAEVNNGQVFCMAPWRMIELVSN